MDEPAPEGVDTERILPSGVRLLTGTRPAPAGQPGKHAVRFELYVPQTAPPRPFFLILHGFAGHLGHLSAHALRLAESAGCVVLNANLSSLLAGGSAQSRNIDGAVEHVLWALSLRGRGGVPWVDPALVSLGGHSAGGAVALVAAAALRRRGGVRHTLLNL